MISAGLKASRMYSEAFSLQLITSIFSRSPISFMTAWTRMPRPPTKVPTGSMPGTVLVTAILVRRPASRAMPLISTVLLASSGTSCLNRASMNSALPRDKRRLEPRSLRSIFLMSTLMRLPTV